MAKTNEKQDKIGSDDRIQSEHDAEAGKGDTSLSVLGHTSASVYDLRDPREDDEVTERQAGRSSSAHGHQDITTLSTMGDVSESVYDRPDEAEGYVGGVQAEDPDQLPKPIEEMVEQPDAEDDIPRVGETEQENISPEPAKAKS